jgi:hypothetical protein
MARIEVKEEDLKMRIKNEMGIDNPDELLREKLENEVDDV